MKETVNTKPHKVKKELGFSLIELLLVIGFISGALVLAFATYPKVQSSNRANVEVQHLIVMAGGIKNLYATSKTYNTLSNNVAIGANVVPNDMKQGGPGIINNVWGGNVDIVPSGASDSTYTITYASVPSSECTKLATSLSVNFIKLIIGANAPLFDHSSGLNIDPALAAAQCSGANSAFDMAFTGN